MAKLMLAACAVLALFAAGAVHADREQGLAQFEEKLPRQSELKVGDGADAGHKSPLEVVARAIKAAKEGKLAELKACLDTDGKRNADENSYMGEGRTNLKEIALYLASYNDEGLKQVAQCTVGNYAIVLCQSPLGTHVVRTVLEGQQQPAKGEEESKPGPKNWYIRYSMLQDFEIDVNAPAVKKIIDAINKGDPAGLKEFLDPFESRTLDLISGVREGVDPFELLARRLRTIISNGGAKPVMLQNIYSTEVAFWFSAEGKDTFIVLNFNSMSSFEDKKKSTEVHVSLSNTASFHAEPASQYSSWVRFWSLGD